MRTCHWRDRAGYKFLRKRMFRIDIAKTIEKIQENARLVVFGRDCFIFARNIPSLYPSGEGVPGSLVFRKERFENKSNIVI